MRPAFASTRQAAAFALLLLVILALPAVMTKSLLPDREQIYSSIWWANGAFPYIDQQIFREKGDIDIAFMGPSHIWNGIDTRYVQEQLSARLGRPATVRTLCWGGNGYDALYFITQDLLQQRKVHMLVFYDAYNEQNEPNRLASRWFRWGDNAVDLKGLPLRIKADYYLASIMGMPRILLSLVRSNLPANLFSPKGNYWEIHNHCDNFVASLGALTSRVGYGLDANSPHVPFEKYSPPFTPNPSDTRAYSNSTKGMFAFSGEAVASWQLNFANKFAEVAREQGSKLVVLHLPILAEARDPMIREREFWPDALHGEVTMLGIPAARLFSGLSDEEVHKLYEDPVHLNENGQYYFTPAITPSLLEIYAAQAHD